jgi:ATP-dependent DNA helicase RecQ
MGIDKADVKLWFIFTENLENYYQEAGRAGRNENKAFCSLATNPSDIIQTENQF